jgi:hypothetical protein
VGPRAPPSHRRRTARGLAKPGEQARCGPPCVPVSARRITTHQPPTKPRNIRANRKHQPPPPPSLPAARPRVQLTSHLPAVSLPPFTPLTRTLLGLRPSQTHLSMPTQPLQSPRHASTHAITAALVPGSLSPVSTFTVAGGPTTTVRKVICSLQRGLAGESTPNTRSSNCAQQVHRELWTGVLVRRSFTGRRRAVGLGRSRCRSLACDANSRSTCHKSHRPCSSRRRRNLGRPA